MTETAIIILVAVLGVLGVCLLLLSVRLRRQSLLLAQMAHLDELEQRAIVRPEQQIGGQYRSEEQFLREIERMGTALWDWNIVPSSLQFTEQFKRFTGYEEADMGTHPAEHLHLIHPGERQEVRRRFEAYFAGERHDCNLEFRFRFKDGEYRWVKSTIVAFRDSEGTPVRVVGSMMDISERVRAEEERDRLFNLSLDMLAVGDYDGYLQQVNPAWVRVLGWSRDDLMAEPQTYFIHDQDVMLFDEALKSLEEGDLVEDLQCRFRCRDKTYKWLSWSSFPYPEQRRVFSVVRDITLQKEAQFSLKESQERLRSLSNQLSLVEDRQRQQLADAIHDGLAQQLFGLRAMITLFRYPEKLPKQAEVVDQALAILDQTMAEARTLSFELFPAELQEVGLEAGLGWMAHDFEERNHVRCSVNVDQEGPELSEDLRAMAYQCVRELFNNVRKHADAEEIRVTLNSVDRFLTVVVADNGRGFEPTDESSEGSRKLDHEGFGLFSIRERVRSVGGRMLVDSHPGQGCRVFLSFPLDPPVS